MTDAQYALLTKFVNEGIRFTSYSDRRTLKALLDRGWINPGVVEWTHQRRYYPPREVATITDIGQSAWGAERRKRRAAA